METQITTNIRITKEDLRQLKLSALRENKSVSAILRELIRQYTQLSGQKKQLRSLTVLEKYAVKTGDKNLARKIDSIVYAE